ncbi:MAG TPA: hypothetical protein ENK18_15395 [Deltaproteobacteria bacterium]|nr:hypothetical protein [Deltaproteobacteria bacterium]
MILSQLLSACALLSSEQPPPPEPTPAPPALRFELDETLQGLRLELSEATRPPPSASSTRPARAPGATALPTAEVAPLFEGLPGLSYEPGDEVGLAKREDSASPPRTGASVALPFPAPPAGAPVTVQTDALSVLRFAPEGEVSLAAHLSITFNQPMIALSSQEQAAEYHPVVLTPQPEGQWRWLGTKTLIFEPELRFPMATTFQVEIPARTTSATGSALAEPTTWTFGTPPPSVVQAMPQDGPQGLSPLVALVFDQAMPETVTEHIQLISSSGPLALEPVPGPGPDASPRPDASPGPDASPRPDASPGPDVSPDEELWLTQLLEAHPPERVVLLRPSQPLQPATSYTIVVPEGTPSAEGPRTTTREQRFGFHTYEPLELDETLCDRGQRRCSPGGTLYLSLNNPLDIEAFDPSWVKIEPTVERLRVRPSHSGIQISGALQAQQRYTVTLSSLEDRFGQILSEPIQTTFQVGDADRQLIGPPQELVVLDPAGPAALSVFSVNLRKLKVRAYRVGPEDLARVSSWMRSALYSGRYRGQPPVPRLASELIEVDNFEDNELIETPVDLTSWLPESGLGHVLLWIEPPTQPREPWRRTHRFAWVQRTTLGLTAVVDPDEIVGWVTSLATGRPLAGVSLQLLGESPQVTTDARGLATLAKYPDREGPHVLIARRGDDVAMLPQQGGWWNEHGSWTEVTTTGALSWFVFDDRGLYKPAETVYVKGWLRRYDQRAGGGIDGIEGLPTTLSWSLSDARGDKLGEGQLELSPTGAFDLELSLPQTPHLGTAELRLWAEDSELASKVHHHTFEIQEFRRPEFEVSTVVDPGPHLLGQSAVVSVHAGYYAGGVLPSAPVSWTVRGTPATFSPPGLSDYRFGSSSWDRGWGGMWGRGGGGVSPTPPQLLEGSTDPGGDHRLKIDLVAVNPPRPYTVEAQATVTDVNRQRWTSSESLLMHPASHYVGLRTDKGFYEPGEEIDLQLVVSDLDGELVDGRSIEVSLSRLDWALHDGRWQQLEEDPSLCTAISSSEAVGCTFVPMEGGEYRLEARITDPQGRPNETVTTVWVSGGTSEQAPSRGVRTEQLTLVPDQERYQPGQTARILVQAPFASAEGLLTVGRGGLLRIERFSMPGTSTTLEVPIGEDGVPNLEVRVDVVGSAPRRNDQGDPVPDRAQRVALATGSVSLAVPPLAQTLTVSVTPRDDVLEPGGQTTLEVEVRDAAGEPVGAEVAVVVVDEAVLALAARGTPDPIAAFYGPRGGGFTTYHNRPMVLLADPESALGAGEGVFVEGVEDELLETDEDGLYRSAGRFDGATAARGGEGSGLVDNNRAAQKEPDDLEAKRRPRRGPPAGASSPEVPRLREDLSAAALFAPHVQADPSGRASVPLTVPDSLTRYRILAVAVSGDRFGVDESGLTARRALMVRPSPPRFLNFGDRAELSVVVQNQTPEAQEVSVGLRMANARALPSVAAEPAPDAVHEAGQRITLAAHDRAELRFAIATESAGQARFQAVARSGAHSDAASFAFPVWTPATSESFASYGELDEGAVLQPVRPPTDAWPQLGGLEVTTSTTAVSALTDAVLYLTQYPYDCTEQLASRVMAIAALRDVLDAFGAPQLPSPETLSASVDADLRRIARRQHGNGGFSFWPRLPPEPYLSVHTTHALVRARDQGYAVPKTVLRSALSYLEHIESHLPRWYSADAKRSIRSYALYVRHRAGQTDGAGAQRLLAAAGASRLPLEAQGWLAPVLQASGRTDEVSRLVRHWNNRITETAAGAQLDTAYGDTSDYVLLHSSRRTDAVLLEALVQVRPQHDVIPKLVRGLMGHRVEGRWSSTQENAFVLLAMDAYFRRFEAIEPDLVARVWLGDRSAGEHAFRGRTTDSATISVPMAWLMDPGGEQELVLAKEGPGRLYYRLALDYAPEDLDLEPADRGFELQRVYEAVDDPGDVQRDEDGTWRVRAGARVRVRLSMVSPARRTHVALTDPMPGGFEALNPELATTGALPADPDASGDDRYWWWSRPWYEHDNLRDERAEAFASLLYGGVYEYTYLATATTPGRFVVPPAKAEEMFHPETFGRTGTHRLVIE